MSPRFTFDRENAQHTFRVFLWTVGSALVTMAIALLAGVEIPNEYLFLVPMVNTGLVALKEFTMEQARKK